MIVYIDESGDLGWKLHLPYRHGGSSKYLTISFLLVPSLKKKYSKRIVKKLYTKFRIDPNHEIKGADLDEEQRDFLTDEIVKLLTPAFYVN